MADYFEIRQTALMDVKHKIGQGMNPADAMESTLERLKVPERDKEIVRGYVMSHIDLSEKSAHKGLSAPAAGEDPLSQPKRKTGRSVGEDQTVLGKSISQDPFAQKSVIDEIPMGEKYCPVCHGEGTSDSSVYGPGNKRCENCGGTGLVKKSAEKSEAPFIMEGEKGDDSPFYVIYAEGTKSQGFDTRAECKDFIARLKTEKSADVKKRMRECKHCGRSYEANDDDTMYPYCSSRCRENARDAENSPPEKSFISAEDENIKKGLVESEVSDKYFGGRAYDDLDADEKQRFDHIMQQEMRKK